MAGRRTSLFVENGTLSTGSVLLGFQTAAAAAAAAICELTRVEITQSGTTTLAQIRGEFSTRDTAGTLTMTSVAPKNTSPLGGPASGLSGNTNSLGGTARSGTISTADSGGTYTQVRPFNFSNLNGYIWKPDSDEEIIVPASTVFIVRFLAAPATLTGWTICLDMKEL